MQPGRIPTASTAQARANRQRGKPLVLAMRLAFGLAGKLLGSVLLGMLLLQGQVLRAQRNLDFKGFLPYAQRLSDVWGFEAGDGTEYALVGVFDGLSIVSLADPENPTEVQFIPGPESIWRDIKTWQQRAYVVNETGGGMLIVDLRDLPGSVDTVGYTGDGLSTAHNIFIDEAGKAFLFGANLDNGGATILDLAPDPDAPEPYGAYRERYIHDGYVRGDTLWGAEIFNGTFSVVDVSQPDTALVLADQSTPTGLTHATWLSDDGATLIAVEETGAGKVSAYNVTDLSDINLESIYRSNWVDSVIPHNSFYRGDWVVNSVYYDGVTIIDAARPSNLVETGRYDTSPLPPASGFGGCWGVYPYFSSGLIAATDIEEGLFILEPEYHRAAYLEGTVRDQDGAPRLFAEVDLPGHRARPFITDFTGTYATGMLVARVRASGCATGFFPVELRAGQVTVLDPVLSCSTSAVGQVHEAAPEIAWYPVPWLASKAQPATLRWDLGAAWQAGATAALIDARGQVLWDAPLLSPAGEMPVGVRTQPGFHLLQVRSGKLVRRLKGLSVRAP